MNKSLIACSILFALSQGTEKLVEIKLGTVGKWKGHSNGPFELTLEDLQEMKTNFENAKVDGVIDLDHSTVFHGTGEAYGWIKSLEVKDNDLWAKIEWLEDGKNLIKAGKYKYISPVFQPNTIDQESGDNIGWTLHSAAITNRPFFEDLGEIVANSKNEYKKIEGEEMAVKKEDHDKVLDENKKLKEAAAKTEEARVENEVNTAIAANKVNKDQKESLITLGKGNPAALTSLLDNAKAIVAKPGDDLFENNNNNNQEKLDVLKLGGFDA